MAGRTQQECGMNSLQTLLPELGVYPLFRSTDTCEMGSNGQYSKLSSEEDIAAKIDAAHALGMAKGGEEVRAETALELEVLHVRHKQDLKSARKMWVEEEGDQLAKLIEEILAEMEVRISQSLQQVMLPFIEKVIPLAALNELEKALENALLDDFRGTLVLSGPEDLVSELEVRLKSKDIDIIAESSPGPELKARSSSFVITTRIANWIETIRGVDHE